MQTKFRFTNAAIKALPAQQREAGATELEFSDTEVIGLKLLSGKSQGSKRFLLRYTLQGKKRSIALGQFGDIDVSHLVWSRNEVVRLKLETIRCFNPGIADSFKRGSPSQGF